MCDFCFMNGPNSKKFWYLLVISGLLVLPLQPLVFAHKPIDSDGKNNSFDKAIEIPNHLVSWVIYENIVHVGARSFVKEELAFKTEHKINVVTDKDVRDGKGPKMVKDFMSTFDKIYVSIDLDVLDPAFAPGVGNPEAMGITSRELFDMIYALEGNTIRCMDIVELCPTYDNGATASVAAKLMSEVIAMNLSRK